MGYPCLDNIRYVPPQKIKGIFSRMVSSEHKEEILSMMGSFKSGGRYNYRSLFGALYLSESKGLCIGERKRAVGDLFFLRTQVIGTIKVSLNKILDLTDSRVLKKLEIAKEDLLTFDYRLSQEIGRKAKDNGFEGIIAPSAISGGKNLIIFMDNLKEGSIVQLIKREEINF